MIGYEIEALGVKVKNAFQILDRLSPSGRDDGDFEEALWQLEKAGECIKMMQASLDDAIHDAKSAQKALNALGRCISEKITNPYHQTDFVSFREHSYHAYA